LAPIKHRDLWQRVDRALTFHQVECRLLRFEPAHAAARRPMAARNRAAAAGKPTPREAGRCASRWQSFLTEVAEQCGNRLRHGRAALAAQAGS
jgi:hypothetical protein